MYEHELVYEHDIEHENNLTFIKYLLLLTILAANEICRKKPQFFRLVDFIFIFIIQYLHTKVIYHSSVPLKNMKIKGLFSFELFHHN